MASPTHQIAGPGFIAVIFDIPFPLAIPNGAYFCYDPQKAIACVEVTLREGSRAFFRNRPIVGPTSFVELQAAAQERERPRQNRDYVVLSELRSGQEKATLNINSGTDGGYAECKYYTEVTVTFLADDIRMVGKQNESLKRAFDILNPFLDKYRLMNQDHRIARVSQERNYYFATCHTSPLASDELHLTPHDLFQRLKEPRTFLTELGKGASNCLRVNSFETLGPRTPLPNQALQLFAAFVQQQYEMSLFYDLLLEALGNLQRHQEYRLAIVHAETAFEVYVRESLLKLMMDSGLSDSDASDLLENERDYWGVKRMVRKLDEWADQYCTRNGSSFTAFVASPLYDRWQSELYKKRNEAVHAGANAFSYGEASAAIGVAKECIVTLEKRIPNLADRVQINPSMSGFRQDAGEVRF